MATLHENPSSGGPLPGPRRGLDAAVAVPPSKSLTNRALVAAAAAGGGRVVTPLDCEDTRLLAAALDAMGWPTAWRDGTVTVGRRTAPADRVEVFLGNSGTGARFLLALAAAVPGDTVVDGTPRLRERPVAPLLGALRRLGAPVEAAGERLPARVRGRELEGGGLTLAPGVSSQFVSALLLAAPSMRRGLDLRLEGRVPSRPYLELTRAVLEAFGATVTVGEDGRRWRVAPGGLKPVAFTVEGDWSAAAFPLAAAAVAGGRVTVANVSPSSAQGDRVLTAILERAGCAVSAGREGVSVEGPAERAFEADLTDAPDLFPALAVVAASVPGGSVLTGLHALRHKESDRLAVMVENLRRLGARVETDGGRMTVLRPFPFGDAAGAAVTAAADHRIAMAMAVAALRAGPLSLDDRNCVAKSYPAFWRDWGRIVG